MASSSSISNSLLRWYDRQKRDLPWRGTRDPWGILVSEFMLQQTRVEAVIPYWHRFMERFPDAAALARASEADVLAAWSGLGYYRRARHLQAAARVVAGEHGGAFPTSPEKIRALPGVGRYTAGAVASIAFGIAAPVVDGNVARVLSRLFALDGDPRGARTAKRLWELAEELLDRARPGDFNQALMELGALVCLPRDPYCLLCPLADACEARRAGTVDAYPARRERRASVAVRLAAAVVRKGDAIGLVKRRQGGLMEGLFDLPAVELAAHANGTDATEALRRHLEETLGLQVRALAPLGRVRHGVTHHKIVVEVFEAAFARRVPASLLREADASGASRSIAAEADASGLRFVREDEIAALGLSSLARKMLATS